MQMKIISFFIIRFRNISNYNLVRRNVNKILENKIQISWKKLTKREQDISKQVINEKVMVHKKSISDLSKILNTSASSINRWCKKLGYEGFKDLQASLKMQSEFNTSYEDSFSYSHQDLIYSISTTERFLNYDELKLVADKINNLKNIIFYGEAFTFLIASYFSNLFNKLGIVSRVVNVASDIATINNARNTVNIFISISGRNPNTKLAFRKATFDGRIFSAMITTNKNHNLKEEVNCSLVGDFFQSFDMDPFELPLVSKTVIDYILQKLFYFVWQNGDTDKYRSIIKQIAKEKS